MTFEFLLFRLSGHRWTARASVVLIEHNLQLTAASLVVLKKASCSLSQYEQGAPGTVSFSQSLQLLDRTSI